MERHFIWHEDRQEVYVLKNVLKYAISEILKQAGNEVMECLKKEKLETPLTLDELPKELLTELPGGMFMQLLTDKVKESALDERQKTRKELLLSLPKDTVAKLVKEIPKEVLNEIFKEISIEFANASLILWIPDAMRDMYKTILSEMLEKIQSEIVTRLPNDILSGLPQRVFQYVLEDITSGILKEISNYVSIEIVRELFLQTLQEIPKEGVKEVLNKIPSERLKEMPTLVMSKLYCIARDKEKLKEILANMPKEIENKLVQVLGKRISLGVKENKTLQPSVCQLPEGNIQRFPTRILMLVSCSILFFPILFAMVKNASNDNKHTGFMESPVIMNGMSGKTKGLVSEWYINSDLHELIAISDPGDLIEIDRGIIQHWGVYAGPLVRNTNHPFQLFCPQDAAPYIVHFGFDPDAPDHHNMLKPAINYNKLAKVVGKSQMRINNGRDERFGFHPAKDIGLVNSRIHRFVNKEKRYHLFANNCEMFAAYCRYGQGIESNQAEIVMLAFQAICHTYTYKHLTGVTGFSELTSVALIFQLTCLAVRYGQTHSPVYELLSLGVLLALKFLFELWAKASTFDAILISSVGWFILQTYIEFVVSLSSAARLIALCAVFDLCVPPTKIYGIRLEVVTYIVGMSYVLHVNGIRGVVLGAELPAGVYVILLNCVASVIGLKFTSAVIVPILGSILVQTIYIQYANA